MIATHAITFPMMIRFLSLRSGRDLSCGTSARLCRRSAIMGASPELFREVDGSRIAAVSVFFRSLVSSEALRPSRQPMRLNPSVVGL
jgi:hypothetical protein